MTLRAETNPAFLIKYLIIGLICTAFGCWASYDGFVAYPAKIPRAEAWEQLLKDESLDETAKDKKYREMAQERDWPIKHPTKDETVEKIKSNIVWQYIFMAIGFGVGVPLLVWYLRNKGSWIQLDGDTIKSSSGSSVRFSEIVKFDKKKWEKKGIGVVHFQRDNQQKKFVIDDLKYNRKITDDIVRKMEGHLKPEQIVNGAPEPALELPS
jgi:hypothetical protein